jgi:SRSO17 transposase
VENCVTTVFSAYVTANGQAWADLDVYMPDRWARDMPRRRAAGIPGDLQFATKPQLAEQQLGRLLAAGLPARWVAFDEVYGRSEELSKKAARAGLSYVAIIPCDYQVTLPSGAVIRADEAVKDAIFERRSCRIEGVVVAYIYPCIGILTHDLPSCGSPPSSIFHYYGRKSDR